VAALVEHFLVPVVVVGRVAVQVVMLAQLIQ
jgi:hypothetical protein